MVLIFGHSLTKIIRLVQKINFSKSTKKYFKLTALGVVKSSRNLWLTKIPKMKGLAFPKPKGSIFFKSSFSRGFSLQTTKNLRFFHQEKKPQSKQSQNSNLEPRKAKKKLTSEQLLKTCLHTKDQKSFYVYCLFFASMM